GPVTSRRSTGCSATQVRASASSTVGRLVARTSRISATAAASVPPPGPTTHACARPASATEVWHTTSGLAARPAPDPDPTERTMPEVAATAADTVRTAAPGYRSEPARTATTPCVYLSSPGPGTGHDRPTSSRPGADTESGPGAGASRPMSTTSTRPQTWEASRCARRATPKVTVTSARTCSRCAVPVSASTPLGRSTATHGTPAPVRAAT